MFIKQNYSTKALKNKNWKEDKGRLVKKSIDYSEKVNLVLAAGTASELNRLLSHLKSQVQYTRVLCHDVEKAEDHLALIEKSIERGVAYLKQLQRQDCLKVDKINLAQLINDSVEYVRPRAKLNHLNIDVRLLDVEVGMLINRVKIFQTLVNLLDNSVDACLESFGLTHKIEVELTCHSQKAYIRVADTGSGVAFEIRDQLFKPLSSSKKHAGAGFGLAVSRQYIVEHGGDLKLESLKNPTTFLIELPIL